MQLSEEILNEFRNKFEEKKELSIQYAGKYSDDFSIDETFDIKFFPSFIRISHVKGSKRINYIFYENISVLSFGKSDEYPLRWF